MDWGFVVLSMELASSIISFIIGYYALKGHRASGARGLFFLYLGFLVLGVGIFLRTMAAVYFALILSVHEQSPRQLLGLLNLTVWIYTLTQLIAYSLFTTTYVLQSRNIEKRNVAVGAVSAVAAAAAPFSGRLFYIPALELVAITLLGFVTAYSFANWLLRRGTDAALVFFGYGFMMLSHVFFLIMIFREGFLLLGQTTQLAGFLCLLAMLAKVSKTDAR